MKKMSRAIAALGAAMMLALTLSSCTTSASSTGADSSSLALPQPWSHAAVTWTQDGNVKNLTALPENIAYTVEKQDSDEFFMYSKSGKALAHLTTPTEFKDTGFITLVSSVINGKTYLAVTQSGMFNDTEASARSTKIASVVTGFDQNGKQLYRKLYASAIAPDLDPITGEPRMEPMHVVEGNQSQKEMTVDGVEIFRMYDVSNLKRYLTGADWKYELPEQSVSVTSVAGLIRISNGSSSTATTHLLGATFCRLINPHTGAEVASPDKLGSSCADIEENLSNTHAIIFQNNSQFKDDISGVLLPESGKSRVFQNFTPYSVDTDGTIYGVMKSTNSDVVASTNINGTSDPKIIDGVQRPPLMITPNGIAAFSADSIAGVQGKMVFAVKN